MTTIALMLQKPADAPGLLCSPFRPTNTEDAGSHEQVAEAGESGQSTKKADVMCVAVTFVSVDEHKKAE